MKLLCFSLCFVIWPIGIYNYSAIHSIKIPELSQRTFKTKGLISIEGTFLGTPCIINMIMILNLHTMTMQINDRAGFAID